MINTTTIKALLKREYLDGKGGFFYTPLVIVAVIAGMVLLSMIFGNGPVHTNDFSFDDVQDKWAGLNDSGKEVISYLAAFAYGSTTLPLLFAAVIVVFFSLLGSLYEDRRDKSLLFWKSMPVSDGLEVGVKLFANSIMGFGIFLIAAIALQVIMSLLISLWFAFKGVPLSVTFPLAQLLQFWVAAIPLILLACLWAAPIFAWLMLVSAASPRMPFMFAIVPVAVIAIIEVSMFNSSHFIEAFAHYFIAGFGESIEHASTVADQLSGGAFDIEVEHEAEAQAALQWIGNFKVSNMYAYTFTQGKFWAGLVVAAGLLFGTIELRKRAQ